MTVTVTVNKKVPTVKTWDEAWLFYEMRYQDNPDEIGEGFISGNKLYAYLTGPMHPDGGYTPIATVDLNYSPKPEKTAGQPQYFEQDDIIGDAIKQQLEFFGFNSAPGVSNDVANSKLWFLVFLILVGGFFWVRKKA